MTKLFLRGLLILPTLILAPVVLQGRGPNDTANDFRVMPFMPEWRLVEAIPIKFDAHHPQGLVKIGDKYYLSTVHVQRKTTRFMDWKTGFDRTAGRGIGRLYEFDSEGRLTREMNLGEGTIYHPGGIDFDGTSIWVPVSEYRPRSQSIIYRINPVTWQAEEVFRVADHIGALVYNRELDTVIGLTWGADFYYEWTPDGHLLRKAQNESQDINYQDCKYVPGPAMLCGGVMGNARGGIELIDLLDFSKIRGIWSVPRTRKKTLMTRNPMTFEWQGDRLRYYFLPENGASALYVYEVR